MDANGFGVIYAKTPEKIMEMLGSIRDPNEYIFLHQKNRENWGKMLNGKLINPKKILGINIEILVDHGAIVPDAAESFSITQIIYILSSRYLDSNTSTIELIRKFRKSPTTADVYRLKQQVIQLKQNIIKSIESNSNEINELSELI